MNFKTKVATFAAASIFALSLGTTAMAAPGPSSVEQKIVANGEGMLTASLGAGSRMTDFTFSLDPGKATGVLVLDVTDARGSYAGWNVTLSATSFQPTGTIVGDAQPIPALGFAVTQPGTLTATKGSKLGINADQNVTLDSQKRILRADANKGTGIYRQELNTELAIPATQPAGTYQSTVTVSIASGPGN